MNGWDIPAPAPWANTKHARASGALIAKPDTLRPAPTEMLTGSASMSVRSPADEGRTLSRA